MFDLYANLGEYVFSKIILLEYSWTKSNSEWAEPTVPYTDLKTLILEDRLSVFNTLTFSDPIPKISFGVKISTLPYIEKYVTIPVEETLPTFSFNNTELLETLICCKLSKVYVEVLNPDIDTISSFLNSWGFSQIPTNELYLKSG